MNRDADNVEQVSRLPVRAASLPPKCSAGKDARRTGSQDRCPATAAFMEHPFFRFCARIGTMNQIGTPLPSLSPQGGEREGVRGRFMESLHDFRITHRDHERRGETPSSRDSYPLEVRTRRSLAPPGSCRVAADWYTTQGVIS